MLANLSIKISLLLKVYKLKQITVNEHIMIIFSFFVSFIVSPFPISDIFPYYYLLFYHIFKNNALFFYILYMKDLCTSIVDCLCSFSNSFTVSIQFNTILLKYSSSFNFPKISFLFSVFIKLTNSSVV